MLDDGGKVKRTRLTEACDYAALQAMHERVVPLVIVADGKVDVITVEEDPVPGPGRTLISIVGRPLPPPAADAAAAPEQPA